MTATNFANLRELRQRLLTYTLDGVARLSGLPADRLRAIEDDGSSPTVYELEALSRIYGLCAETLADRPIQLGPGDSVQTLACLDEFREVNDVVRSRIIAAANAARDLRVLQQLNDVAPPAMPSFKDRDLPPARLAPFRQGAVFADHLRKVFRQGDGPIESVRDFVVDQLPGIELLYADLTSDGPAGITFADRVRGPCVVLNLQGRNANPGVRRFSLAHELCHVLLDGRHAHKLAVLSGYLSEAGLDKERRANAFAVRFICPEKVLRKLKLDEPHKAARHLLEEYGLHYGAVRLYLLNEAGVSLPRVPPPELSTVGTDGELERREEPRGVLNFPISFVPPERRTGVASLAARAYSTGKLTRDGFADLVGLTPADDVERILDFFGLTSPPDSLVA